MCKESTPPPPAAAPKIQGVTIQNCHIENGTVTKAAAETVQALANAATENAKAIAEIAKCFRPGQAEMKYGIALLGGKDA